MALVKEAICQREVSEFGALETLGVPVDLGHRAGPSLGSKGVAEPFREAPIETGIVCHDEGSRRYKMG
jgi:hypothetical protein